ncbi:MAG TPA: TauD/TfdA family dioxygenase [Acetobacteraceae bacterium]|nr:TauD/TfdA family dioxygenase [Acetobacteraceae bacterium]
MSGTHYDLEADAFAVSYRRHEETTMSTLRGGGGPRIRYVANEEAPYETITVDKLTPIIGAEIGGVDLARPSNRQMDEIHRALAENLVIFFRDQHLTPEQHLSFGRQFGDLHLHPAAPHAPGHPELMIIHADKDSPRANGEGWHSDVSCDPEPPMGSILYIRQCPPRGGDTLFASMYAAYEALSERMKAYLDGLTAIHDGEDVYRGLYQGVADKPSYPRAEHPVIRTHPVTGKKALYVNRGFTRRIVGLPRDESDAILGYLYSLAENPLFQCRFRWRENSVAFWDNRCTQHRAMWDYWPHTRSGHRVTVKGERPT